MSAEYVLKFDAEKIREMPMVDLAFEVLKAANTPFYYRDLMMEIAKIRGFSEEQINEVIAQLYTEINIDGRFACVGSNVWGLKRWYPVERSEDAVAGAAKRPRIINDDDDDEDLYSDDEEETEEVESFDLFDEDRDELFDEGEEASEVGDDEAIDEEDDSGIEEEIDEEDQSEEEEEDSEESSDEEDED